MSEPLQAVLDDGYVTRVVVLDADTARQWQEDGTARQVFGGGVLMDVTDVDPTPGIGWRWDGAAWVAPPGAGAPAGEQEPPRRLRGLDD